LTERGEDVTASLRKNSIPPQIALPAKKGEATLRFAPPKTALFVYLPLYHLLVVLDPTSR